MADFSGFTTVIEEYLQLFDDLIAIEQEKLTAAVKNQVSFVEDCINKEQAAMLKMRGLEQRREKEQQNLGFADLPFREILAQVPEDTAHVLRPLFEILTQRLTAFRSVSDSAKDAIQVNLHNIQIALAAQEAGNKTYTPTREQRNADKKKPFTSRSV